MAKLNKVIRITETDYTKLLSGYHVVANGMIFSYDENALYEIVRTDPHPYAQKADYATRSSTAIRAIADGNGEPISVMYLKKRDARHPLVIEASDEDYGQRLPSGTFDSIQEALENGKEVILKVTLDSITNTVGYYQLTRDAANEEDQYIFQGVDFTFTISDNELLTIEENEFISSNNPRATTAPPGTNTTQIATTAFVQDAVRNPFPIASKSYTDGIISTNSSFANYCFYYASVRPTSWDAHWRFKIKVHCWVPTDSNYDAVSIWEETGIRNIQTAYYCQNAHLTTSYRAFYYHYIYLLKEAGYNNGLGHVLGISIGSATNYQNANYKRNFSIEVLEQENCTLTLFNEPLKWANVTGQGSTNYDTYQAVPAYNNGLWETGDSDTYNSTYVWGFRPRAGAQGIFAYSPLLLKSDGVWENVVTTNTVNATKERNTNGFVVGQVLLSVVNVGANNVSTSDAHIYVIRPNIDVRYLINGTTADVTVNVPIYLVGEIHSDGLFYLDSPWWTQTLPTTDDGKVYWHIGYVANSGNWDFSAHLPIYHYKNGAIRIYPAT